MAVVLNVPRKCQQKLGVHRFHFLCGCHQHTRESEKKIDTQKVMMWSHISLHQASSTMVLCMVQVSQTPGSKSRKRTHKTKGLLPRALDKTPTSGCCDRSLCSTIGQSFAPCGGGCHIVVEFSIKVCVEFSSSVGVQIGEVCHSQSRVWHRHSCVDRYASIALRRQGFLVVFWGAEVAKGLPLCTL